jgi:hypothetical protein
MSRRRMGENKQPQDSASEEFVPKQKGGGGRVGRSPPALHQLLDLFKVLISLKPNLVND